MKQIMNNSFQFRHVPDMNMWVILFTLHGQEHKHIVPTDETDGQLTAIDTWDTFFHNGEPWDIHIMDDSVDETQLEITVSVFPVKDGSVDMSREVVLADKQKQLDI